MKLNTLYEKYEADIQKAIPKLKGKTEKAIVNGEVFTGKEDEVSIELQNVEDEHKLIIHDHNPKTKTALDVMPSKADLVTAVESFKLGYPGIAIVSGKYFSTIEPKKDDINIDLHWRSFESSLEKSLNDKDINHSLNELQKMGFDANVGSNPKWGSTF